VTFDLDQPFAFDLVMNFQSARGSGTFS
jgi:hypothetical protein